MPLKDHFLQLEVIQTVRPKTTNTKFEFTMDGPTHRRAKTAVKRKRALQNKNKFFTQKNINPMNF